MSDLTHGRRRLALIGVLVALPMALQAAEEIRKERVHFDPGTTGTTIEGHIKGYETVDYVLGARQGQSLTVSMTTRHTATYFNILAPGEDEVAMFVGSINGNQYEGTLPASGDYKIRVYMMRSAARRNETADYRLAMSITDAGPVDVESEDALVPGTDFHATGNVPCSMGDGQPTRDCPFGVKRQRNGSASVFVTKPDGRTRVIFFENGQATGYDQSQADTGKLSAEKQNDLFIVHIGAERYEIPDIVVFGD